MASRPTQLSLGAGLVALYVALAVATTTWAPGRMRPLFDGFGSHPGQYNWVNPPREFAEGNREPESATAGIVMEADGSGPASVSPTDGQALAALPPGSVPPHPPDTAGTLELTPVDAVTLGPLPAGVRAEGNAYLVAVTYVPSGTPAALAQPGSVGLTAAARADILLFSADGRTWQRRQGTPLTQGNGLTGLLEEPGYYLAAAEGEPRPTSTAAPDRAVHRLSTTFPG